MFQLLKLMFPKFWFGLEGDPDPSGGDPQPGNDPDPDDGNDPDPAPAPTEIVIGETKVSIDQLKSHPELKNYFEAYENRERWQAENTRKSQEIKQYLRDAQEYRRLKSDPRFQQLNQPAQPANRLDAVKQRFLETARQRFGDAVNSDFVSMLFDAASEVSRYNAQEAIAPFQNHYLGAWEKQFVKDHPLVKPGSEKYEQLRDLCGSGLDPEQAYKNVYFDEILNAELEDRIKKRDLENTKKLKQSRNAGGTTGKKSTLKGDDVFEDVWAEHGA